MYKYGSNGGYDLRIEATDQPSPGEKRPGVTSLLDSFSFHAHRRYHPASGIRRITHSPSTSAEYKCKTTDCFDRQLRRAYKRKERDALGVRRQWEDTDNGRERKGGRERER